MYDIKQFRPSLYLVVLLGITGFCMAAESPGLWVFSVALLLTNAYLVRQDLFRPAPRALTASISIIAFVFAFFQARIFGENPIIAVGEFLVVLQIVKIWEQRANRDYAQLLVLSLLLMVSAAISTASLLFGLLFIVYLFLSLYACLLFHLKVETDEAKAALPPSLAKWEEPLRQDQRHIARSMRRLTGLVAVYALGSAVLVFVLFPRFSGAGMFGQYQWRPKNTLTGFSEEVSFQQVAKITQNDEVVGTVKIWKDGELIPFAEPIYLRGVTHDYYNGNDDSDHAAYQWTHGRDSSSDRWQGFGDEMNDDSGSGVWTPGRMVTSDGVRVTDPQLPRPHYRQEISLNPTGTSVLFALAGVVSIRPEEVGNMRRLPLRYSHSDQTIRVNDSITQPIRYMVESTGKLNNEPTPWHPSSVIDPKVVEFARRPDVAGDLASQRDAQFAVRTDRLHEFVSPLDEQIARRIEAYLKRHFKYTLDLTTVDRLKGRDPMVAFLYDFKKGHCEYFAGAMTLMCQSLGLDARLVIGFKCDDYNNFGHFYTLRQSQAHAWVEVRTTDGWKTFDPTSGNSDINSATTAWAQTRRFFDFLEYSWQNSVINYNSENRDNLLNAAESTLNQTAIHSSQSLSGFRDAMDNIGNALASKIVGPLIGLLTLAIFAAVGWFFAERWKLHRRAERIGIVDLPASAQVKLMRQLEFYDELLRLLERNRIIRPPHLTPLEFCDTLSFLPTEAYDTIHRITELFYRIRFGRAELSHGQQRHLVNVIDRLASKLNAE